MQQNTLEVFESLLNLGVVTPNGLMSAIQRVLLVFVLLAFFISLWG